MSNEHSWLEVGNMVELRGEDHGYEGSWFSVTITKLKYTKKNRCNEVHVEYLGFFEANDPDSRHLVEVVKPTILRPLCPNWEEEILKEANLRQQLCPNREEEILKEANIRQYKVGDVIEAQHDGACGKDALRKLYLKKMNI